MANEYSDTWFKVFLEPAGATDPDRELAFLTQWFALPTYGSLLDLCCGSGRLSNPLAHAGYTVVGLDQNAAALCSARRRSSAVRFVRADMRHLPFAKPSFDAVACLWQSFGYFDDKTNQDVLSRIRELLKPMGRLVLDVYNAEFFPGQPAMRTISRAGREIRESKSLVDKRLIVELDYGDGTAGDRFDWRLYHPLELCDLAEHVGFEVIAVCANFDSLQGPSSSSPRMQLVLQVAGK